MRGGGGGLTPMTCMAAGLCIFNHEISLGTISGTIASVHLLSYALNEANLTTEC